MTGHALHYFACGNTAKGFFTLLDTNLAGLAKLCRLEGGTARGRTALIRHCGETWQALGHGVEYLHCALDVDHLDGVIAPSLSAAMLTGEGPHAWAGPEGADIFTVDCGAPPPAHREEIGRLRALSDDERAAATAAFARALQIHDEWEALYIAALDREAHRRETRGLIDRVLAGHCARGPAIARHRFLGGATPAGARDFIPELTAGIAKRYFLKGRPGTGKSTLLRHLAAAAAEAGIPTEIYHCGFDPDSLDMVILRDMGVAVIDTTAPHEHAPGRESDEIFDLYEKVIAPGTDERHAEQLAVVSAAYKAAIRKGIAALARAKAARDEVEALFGEGVTEEARKQAEDWAAGCLRQGHRP